MAAAGAVIPKLRGGAFLLEESTPGQIFSVEDLSEDHLAIARTASEFFAKEVAPNIDSLLHQEPGMGPRLLRKSAELGLTAITIPEEYGGLEMDLASAIVAGEQLARDASYAGWHSAHTGIGTLPVLYFGTSEQKRKYLPKLASAEMIAAYALTEPQAGSDALAARTRADLTPDGKHYLLNGQKMWITNGGAAELFTVFAKVGGERFSAFLVERDFGGVTSGVEEKKMGIKGSSTTAVYFENVLVPVENLLGEVGRGHIIAFNILNMGRLKLGAVAAAGAKNVLAVSLKYAKERKAFGRQIGEFGAIQHKLAEMAIRCYAAESAAWRIVGMIQGQLEEFSWAREKASESMLKAVEEYAVECSIIKVYGSEVLDYVVDEGVQIHGGYGFHQDYAVERSYRDSRINRIFEGTSEINRLLITGMLLKRAGRGQLDLLGASQRLLSEIQSGKIGSASSDEEIRLVANAKNIALLTLGMAYQKFGAGVEKQQEVMMRISDIVMEAFAMESMLLRTRKLVAAGKASIAAEMNAVFLRDAMAQVEVSARSVVGACSEAAELGINMSVLRKLAVYDPIDSVTARRTIAKRLLERERFVV
jgi:alkylation response protein AidB-like acyl-CoA dehydrogenase